MSADRLDRALQLRGEGLAWWQCAQRLGVSSGQVLQRILKRERPEQYQALLDDAERKRQRSA